MNIKVDLRTVKQVFANNRKLKEQVLDAAYDVFYKNTPVRLGNARRNTYLTSDRSRIVADYPYAQRLDEGYSKQSPDGMTQPTLEFIEDEIQKYINQNEVK